jgi:hypothetical protein
MEQIVTNHVNFGENGLNVYLRDTDKQIKRTYANHITDTPLIHLIYTSKAMLRPCYTYNFWYRMRVMQDDRYFFLFTETTSARWYMIPVQEFVVCHLL